MPVNALYPSDFNDQTAKDLNSNLHGENLQGKEFVKYSLSGFDLSDANLTGSFFSVSSLKNANLSGANLQDVIAYATRFDNADLSGANLRGADLLKSNFKGAKIDGADFSDALLDRSQQEDLCSRASGITYDSLNCAALSDAYVPASESVNSFNPGS